MKRARLGLALAALLRSAWWSPPSAGVRRRRAGARRRRAPEGRPLRRRARVRRAAPAGRARAAAGGLGGLAAAGGAAAPRAAARALRGRCPAGCATSSAACPASKPAVVVGAHYDTKALPGFVGANDGAGGTAAVLELARVLRPDEAARGRARAALRALRRRGGHRRQGRLLPSAACAARRPTRRATPRAARASSLLDFVADKELAIPREEGSDPALWARLRAAAQRVGAQSAFPAGTQSRDHRRPHPVRARRRPRDRPDRLRLPLLAPRCDDMSAVSRALARPLTARPCSSCCGPGAS